MIRTKPASPEQIVSTSPVNNLEKIIIEKIQNHGPVSFKDFMEMALYHPLHGYYCCSGNKIGKKGDYFTGPTLSPLFGHMIAMQLEEMWAIMGENAFSIVEYGAGTGTLCYDILSYLKNNNEAFYNQLNYYIVERSKTMREREQSLLEEKVQWINSIRDISPVSGCILSNELLDNFPVHKVVMLDELMEVFVDHTADHGFVELSRPAASILGQYFTDMNVYLPKGYITEVNPDALQWLKEISDNLYRGFVFTMDYGYTSGEMFGNKIKNGTIHCYHKHRVNNDPYINIGTQDITSFVNFPALKHYGDRYGLSCCGFSSQPAFLHSLGFATYLQKAEKKQLLKELSKAEKNLLVSTLLLTMGEKFKVFIQQKGMNAPELSGMKFSLYKI